MYVYIYIYTGPPYICTSSVIFTTTSKTTACNQTVAVSYTCRQVILLPSQRQWNLGNTLHKSSAKLCTYNIICSMTCSFTLTGRFTPRPHSCSLTCASTASHQSVACITSVGGCFSICCSSSVTNLANGSDYVSQSTTVHSCQKEEHMTVGNLNCKMMQSCVPIGFLFGFCCFQHYKVLGSLIKNALCGVMQLDTGNGALENLNMILPDVDNVFNSPSQHLVNSFVHKM